MHTIKLVRLFSIGKGREGKGLAMFHCGVLTSRRGGHISVFCKGPIRNHQFMAYEVPSEGTSWEHTRSCVLQPCSDLPQYSGISERTQKWVSWGVVYYRQWFSVLEKDQKSKPKAEPSEDRDSHTVGLKIITLVRNAFAAIMSFLLLPNSLKYNSEGKTSFLILKFPSLMCLASFLMSERLCSICKKYMWTGRDEISFPGTAFHEQ